MYNIIFERNDGSLVFCSAHSSNLQETAQSIQASNPEYVRFVIKPDGYDLTNYLYLDACRLVNDDLIENIDISKSYLLAKIRHYYQLNLEYLNKQKIKNISDQQALADIESKTNALTSMLTNIDVSSMTQISQLKTFAPTQLVIYLDKFVNDVTIYQDYL